MYVSGLCRPRQTHELPIRSEAVFGPKPFWQPGTRPFFRGEGHLPGIHMSPRAWLKHWMVKKEIAEDPAPVASPPASRKRKAATQEGGSQHVSTAPATCDATSAVEPTLPVGSEECGTSQGSPSRAKTNTSLLKQLTGDLDSYVQKLDKVFDLEDAAATLNRAGRELGVGGSNTGENGPNRIANKPAEQNYVALLEEAVASGVVSAHGQLGTRFRRYLEANSDQKNEYDQIKGLDVTKRKARDVDSCHRATNHFSRFRGGKRKRGWRGNTRRK